MPAAGQRYKDPKTGYEYEFIGGDRWNPVSPTYGGRSNAGNASVTSFQLGYQDPASTPVSNPTPASTPNINSATGTQNPAAPSVTQTPAKTEVSREDLGGGKIRIRYSDGTVKIQNPGRQQGASVAPVGPANGGGITSTGDPTRTNTQQYYKGQMINNGRSFFDGTKIVDFKEGDTWGQGAQIFRNGNWSPNTPPPANNPPPAGPLPSSVNPTENLIAPQDLDNPVSNAQALGRAVGAEHSPFTYTAADVLREAQGLGLEDYIPGMEDINSAVDLYNRKADQDYQQQQFDLSNTYAGAGIGGQKVLRSGRLANEYAVNKGLGAQNLRNQMMGEGYNRRMGSLGLGQGVLNNRQALTEGRYGQSLAAALAQSNQQTGLTQQERQRAWQTGENQAARTHEAATAQSLANQQGRAAVTAAIMPRLLEAIWPRQDNAQDTYMKTLAAEAMQRIGLDPNQAWATNDPTSILDPAYWIQQLVLGGLNLEDLGLNF